jgi:hypothetical protein
MILDEGLLKLRRKFESDPEDLEAALHLIDGLRRRQQPFLDEALVAVANGLPIGAGGLDRSWFQSYWRAFEHRVEGRAVTDFAGPFVVLRDRYFDRAVLESFDLRYADLSGCHMPGLNAAYADLRDALLVGAGFGEESLGAEAYTSSFANARLCRSDLSRADLTGANLWAARLVQACLLEASLDGAILNDAVFNDANLSKASMNNARAYGAQFQGALLEQSSCARLIFDAQTRWPESFDPFVAGALAEI